MTTRRNLLDLLNQPASPDEPTQDESIYDQLCDAISKETFIPVIGDAVRIAHIFDVDEDEDIGVDDELTGPNGDQADTTKATQQRLKLNVIEELAYYWAKAINYPLSDRYRIARVAQFQALKKRKNPTQAKEDYLKFLRDTLLTVAENVARFENDPGGVALVSHLRRDRTLSFARIVRELDFPRFPAGKEDPLRLLARLPLKIYITTSYHNFIEQALIAEEKQPRSRLCFWNMQSKSVKPEHRPKEAYEPDKDNPVVYHLLGMEEYPPSLVLTEDDYLDFLWKMAQNPPGQSHSAAGIIPPYLEAELTISSLLLLGYRLQDWDFRVLFRGLLNASPDMKKIRPESVAVQIDLEEQPLVENHTKANHTKVERYLRNYFEDASFRVKFGDSDDFVRQLWDEWQRSNQGEAA